jgi:diketogulonate reductase-like aldo/keto reductase
VFAIPKSAKLARVRENAAAAGLQLSREEIVRIEEAFPVRRGRGLPSL